MKKEKENLGTIKDLKPILKFYGKSKWSAFFSVFFMVMVAAAKLLVAIFAGNLLSSFVEGFDWRVSLKWTALLFLADFLHSTFYYLYAVAVEKTMVKVNTTMAHAVVDRLNSLQQKNFDNQGSLVYFNRIKDDISRVTDLIDTCTYSLITVIGGLSFLSYTLYINVWIGLFLTVYAIIYTSILFIRSRLFKKDKAKIMKHSDENGSILLENIRGMRDIRSLNSGERVAARCKDYATEDQRLFQRCKIRHSSMQYLSNGVLDVFNFVFVALCIFLIVKGQLFVAGFMIAYNYRDRIFEWANCAGDFKHYLDMAILSAHRINDLFNEEKYPVERFGDEELTNFEGYVELKDVKFGYVEGLPVLKGLSLKVEPNTIVSIVGESGGGKSTIISLINKLYDLKEGDGEILLDGKNINTLTAKSLRDSVCIVSQAPYIFDMSFAENLKLANPDATEEEMIDVLKKAELYDFVMSQKDGINTRLGENGIKLSGGQKQRLAIARSLLKKAKVIVYDEATSSLDNDNQEKIKEIMKGLSSCHTIIMVAHRLSTVVDSDNIIFIKDGKVLAEGTHKKLIKDCADYKKLYLGEEKIDSQQDE